METRKKKVSNHRLNPSPDPLPVPSSSSSSSSAIQSISNRFRKLGIRERSAASISHNSSAILTKSSSLKAGMGEDSAKLGFRESKEKEEEATRRMSSSSIIPSPSLLTAALGGRRSFCSSKIELAGFFSSSGAKSVAVDMPPFMQIHAVDCARKTHDSLEKFTSKTLALTLKKEFDGVYGPAWHCIVGTSFGSFVTHSVGGFIYFSLDHKLYILLFKTSVQRASS
ncbi:hypothetical protein M569_17147 [Genlisea aurea]|uniref:Dynein light chain n=1 Tax=Genlisea aurea TaxID=192259 RepID=S8BSU6_9LAMI|nr:hypothetical protein M569_17147 [Genlisea aurea]